MRRIAIVLGILLPQVALAHNVYNLGFEKFNTNTPSPPALDAKAPIAGMETQRMALNMDTADCATLEALDDEAKHGVMLMSIYLQRPGGLSRIVGPDCQFLGPVQEVAVIEDAELTVSGGPEILYVIEQQNMLIVSNIQENSIAYGIEMHDEKDPLQAFLDHRQHALSNAALGRAVAKTIEANPEPELGVLVNTSSSEPSAKTASSKKQQSRRVVERASNSSTKDIAELAVAKDDSIDEVLTSDSKELEPTAPVPAEEIPEQPQAPVWEKTEDGIPVVSPIGPELPEEEVAESGGMSGFRLVIIFFGVIILVGSCVAVLKTRASKKDGLLR